MIEIRNQKIGEVDTNRYERHGFISVSIWFNTAMVCRVSLIRINIVWILSLISLGVVYFLVPVSVKRDAMHMTRSVTHGGILTFSNTRPI